jgi:hypothetical protein
MNFLFAHRSSSHAVSLADVQKDFASDRRRHPDVGRRSAWDADAGNGACFVPRHKIADAFLDHGPE